MGLRGMITFLDEQRESVAERFGQESPWWLPGALEDRLFDRHRRRRALCSTSVLADPQHEIRRVIDRAARGDGRAAAARSGPCGARGRVEARGDGPRCAAAVERELVERHEGRTPRASARPGVGATDEGGERRQRRWPAPSDRRPAPAKVDDWAEAAGRFVVENYRSEIGGLITTTVSRWDGEETSDKLELLLGRDLQFIRINGTLVGALRRRRHSLPLPRYSASSESYGPRHRTEWCTQGVPWARIQDRRDAAQPTSPPPTPSRHRRRWRPPRRWRPSLVDTLQRLEQTPVRRPRGSARAAGSSAGVLCVDRCNPCARAARCRRLSCPWPPERSGRRRACFGSFGSRRVAPLRRRSNSASRRRRQGRQRSSRSEPTRVL